VWFRKGIGCTDMAFTVRELVKKAIILDFCKLKEAL